MVLKRIKEIMDDNGNITCNDYNNSSIKEASEVKIVGEAET